jgi:hypothetical protein
MRRLVLVSIVSLLATACGGDEKSPGLSGTVGGKPFAPADARSVQASTGATTCSLPSPIPGGGTLDLLVTGAKIDFTAWADACADYASAVCVPHPSSQSVSIVLARLGQPSGTVTTAPPLAATTYTLQSSPTVVNFDPEGFLVVAYAYALSTDASGDGTPSGSVTGGKVRLTSVTASGLSGTASIDFADGSTFSGDFSAPGCGSIEVDICQLAETQSFCTPE